MMNQHGGGGGGGGGGIAIIKTVNGDRTPDKSVSVPIEKKAICDVRFTWSLPSNL